MLKFSRQIISRLSMVMYLADQFCPVLRDLKDRWKDMSFQRSFKFSSLASKIVIRKSDRKSGSSDYAYSSDCEIEFLEIFVEF